MTDIEQAPIFSPETNNISGMERLESYVSSYRCVGSFSYEPNNQRDDGSFRTRWGMVQRNLEAVGVGGGGCTPKGSFGGGGEDGFA